MKRANEFLSDIKNGVSKGEFDVKNHPAKLLDDYMKEQYIMLLFSVLKESDADEKAALSLILYIAECTAFAYTPEKVVKYLFNFKQMRNDCIVSFRDEEIRYLLGFELYMVSLKVSEEHSAAARAYISELFQQLEIPDTEWKKYGQIYEVVSTDDLDCYTLKECYLHSSILKCYLDLVDFSGERYIGESNTYPDFPMSANYIVKKFDDELKRISYFDFIVTSRELGNITTRFYGIQVTKCSDEEEKKYRYDEYALKSQKAEGNHYQECDIDIGAVFIFYNHKNSFHAPVLVITHPLDTVEGAEAYIESEYKEQ